MSVKGAIPYLGCSLLYWDLQTEFNLGAGEFEISFDFWIRDDYAGGGILFNRGSGDYAGENWGIVLEWQDSGTGKIALSGNDALGTWNFNNAYCSNEFEFGKWNNMIVKRDAIGDIHLILNGVDTNVGNGGNPTAVFDTPHSPLEFGGRVYNDSPDYLFYIETGHDGHFKNIVWNGVALPLTPIHIKDRKGFRNWQCTIA